LKEIDGDPFEHIPCGNWKLILPIRTFAAQQVMTSQIRLHIRY